MNFIVLLIIINYYFSFLSEIELKNPTLSLLFFMHLQGYSINAKYVGLFKKNQISEVKQKLRKRLSSKMKNFP